VPWHVATRDPAALAKHANQPELAEGLEGTWRQRQAAAIVREIFRQWGLSEIAFV